jgi:hypothetical protein
MEWLKSWIKGNDFHCEGRLVRLGDPDDNYTSKVEFNSATLYIKKHELKIVNDDYDEEQEQLTHLSFPLTAEAQIIHYSRSDLDDVDVIIYGVKWVNLTAKGSHDEFFGFEFESHEGFQKFASHINNFVTLDDEGYQDPTIRTKNPKSSNSKLLVSITNKASNISKQQLMPEFNETEETKARYDLNFKKEAIFSLSHLYSADSIQFVSAGDLYMLGPNLPAPVLADMGIGFLIIKHPQFRVSLDIVRNAQIVMRILIDDNFFYQIYEDKKTVSWVEPVSETERRTWRAELTDSVDNLVELINVAKFEHEKKMLFSELGEEDQRYVRGDRDAESELSEKQDPMEIDFDEPLQQPVDEDMEDINDSTIGWNNSKVIVSRKGKFCIYSNSEQSVQKDAVIYLDKTPTSMILQKQDTQLLFLSENAPNIVYQMDIERGMVVNEFTVQDRAFMQLCQQSKMSSLTDRDTFIGLCEKSMYTFDPRSQNKIVQEFKYSTNPGFTCMSTTDQGYAAVASLKGDIRLYKEIGKKSTTNLPSLGSGIKSIDTTKNGDWLLATTSTYLLVVRTRLGGELAYTKALARKLRPPKKLTLTPEDINTYNILKLEFSPAKFNVNPEGDENSIITSTGKFVIIWNFLSVKANKLYDYVIKPVDERVIKNEFKFGEDSAVLTYPRTITVQKSRWNLKNLNN